MPYKDKNSQEAKESMARRNKRYYDKNKETLLEKKRPLMSEYYKNNKSKWVATTEHNVMNRRKRMFGIDSNAYYEILKRQNNRCAICGKHKDDFKYSLCVDHNHKDGRVRGLLCHGCNVGIGRMNDNVETLQNAIKYLTQFI